MCASVAVEKIQLDKEIKKLLISSDVLGNNIGNVNFIIWNFLDFN